MIRWLSLGFLLQMVCGVQTSLLRRELRINALAVRDLVAITRLDLRTKVITHIRCSMQDANVALDTGVDGIDIVIGTSSMLREFSHGKDIDQIIAMAQKVIDFVQSQGVEVRFSTEDSFRSQREDLFRVYEAVDALHRAVPAQSPGAVRTSTTVAMFLLDAA